MQLLKTALSKDAPRIKDGLWLRPVEGGFILNAFYDGSWKPLRLADDQGTSNIGDDKAKSLIRVTDIKALTNKQCNALNIGDQVIKKTGTQTHLYTVTFKDETNGGMCLSYIDAENAETVAYDKEGKNWKWTDTTITPLGT